ncbi:DUF2946 domain-containing protein [Magnetovibrio blakemorei]|nr:DUF2946 domain-containing protein [Magnetovibrio blakemorei]
MTSRSGINRHTRQGLGWRKWSGNIALWAMVLQIIAPLLLSGANAANLDAGLKQFNAICTANGIVYLQFGDEDDPEVPVSTDCPFCQLHALSALALPSEQLLAFGVKANTHFPVPTSQRFVPPAHLTDGDPTRGPPA